MSGRTPQKYMLHDSTAGEKGAWDEDVLTGSQGLSMGNGKQHDTSLSQTGPRLAGAGPYGATRYWATAKGPVFTIFGDMGAQAILVSFAIQSVI